MVIRAAGGVLWRLADGGELQVAVIHRPRYDDWTLPKGKLDPGESWLAGALREVEEETGHVASPGTELGEVRYRVGRGPDTQSKVVRYWAMEAADGGSFRPSIEVDQVRWVNLDEARSILTRRTDRAVLERFARSRE